MFPTFKYQNTLATQRYANALYDVQLGSTTMGLVLEDMASSGQDAAFNSYFEAGFGTATTADIAAIMTENFNVIDGENGLTAADVTVFEDVLQGALDDAVADGIPLGSFIVEITEVWSTLTGNAVYGAAAASWNAEIADAMAYTGTTDVEVGTAIEAPAFLLTSGIDNITGTSGDDFFDAPLAQNSTAGGVSNTLSTADTLDGGAGNDTLNATLVAEFFGSAGLQQIDIQPEIANIENIQLEAKEILSDSLGALGAVTAPWSAITFDAKDVTDVDHIGSYYSDGDLVIENLTTLTSSGVIRNTEDITITMDHTDNFNSDFNASDLFVYFDDDYLISGQDTSGSTLTIRLLNAVQNEAGNNPVEGFTEITFAVGATNVVVDITSVSTDPTLDFTTAYNEIVDLINAQLIADGFVNVTASAPALEDAVFSIPVAGFNTGDDAGDYYPIIVTNSGPEVLTGIDIATAALAYDTDLNNSFTNILPQTTNNPITVNVELHKAGRAGEGGDLIIGGKGQNNDPFGNNEDISGGIDTFNIDVLGDEDKPSNIGNVASTNNALTTVNIATAAAFVGGASFASLTVRDAFNAVGGTAMETINANAFLGDLDIGQDTRSLNVDTFTATGGGDVTYLATIDGTEKGFFAHTTGAGDDTVSVILDGDAVDSIDTGLSISTAGGEDTVTVTNSDAGTGVSDLTNLALGAEQGTPSNLTIMTGADDDTINIFAEDIFYAHAGAGSDFVHVDANNALGGVTGTWVIGDGTVGPATDWQDRVLYEATLTVDFAGFEETVTIPTTQSGNFVANQEMINDAVIAAIAANPELARLLTATKGVGDDGSEVLTITSANQGVNDLTIQVVQPEVILPAAVAAAGQVNLVAAHINALEAGFLATRGSAYLAGNAVDSATIDQTAVDGGAQDVLDVFDATSVDVLTTLEGNLSETGAGGSAIDFVLDSADGTDGLNDAGNTSMAIIDMGTGANDLVVLDSDTDSMDTVVFSAAWGKVSILNFFDAQGNDDGFPAAPAANDTVIDHTAAGEVVGEHILDFTAWLDDQVTTSGSSLSGVRIATTVEVDLAGTLDDFVANEVTIVNDFAVGVDANETWANMTAADVQNSLNAGVDVGTVATGYGNLDNDGTVVATPTLLGATSDQILMIENNTNAGEYKVFNLEVVEATDVYTVQLLGVIDVGETLTTAAPGLLDAANFA